MPVVVVAILPVKPESADAVREILTKTIAEVHEEPGCELYSLHETNDSKFVFVEQWADEDALKVHSSAPAVTTMFAAISEHMAGAPEIILTKPVPAGDTAKGQLLS